jgi:integrase
MGVKVRQRDGAWWLFIDHKGKRKAKRVGTGPHGKKAAQQAAQKIQARLALGDGAYFEDDRQVPTFQEAAGRWLHTHSQLGQIRPSTRADYARTLRLYAYPRFGTKAITAVTRDDVRGVVVDLLAQGKSRSLARNLLAPVRQTFNQLIDDGMKLTNPGARMGRYLKAKVDPRSRIDPLILEEERSLLETARTAFPGHYPLFLCALRTGMRLGELFGLQWGDIDFQGHFIEVRRTVKDGGQVFPPKNGKIRRVDLSDQLADTLRALLVERKAETLRSGWPQLPEWVFCSEAGTALHKSGFERRVFHKLLAKSGLRRIRFHDLRHTFASRLIQNRESLVYVKEQMGHHSIQVTVDIDGHLVPGANRSAVNRLDEEGGGATIRNPHATRETCPVESGAGNA